MCPGLEHAKPLLTTTGQAFIAVVAELPTGKRNWPKTVVHSSKQSDVVEQCPSLVCGNDTRIFQYTDDCKWGTVCKSTGNSLSVFSWCNFIHSTGPIWRQGIFYCQRLLGYYVCWPGFYLNQRGSISYLQLLKGAQRLVPIPEYVSPFVCWAQPHWAKPIRLAYKCLCISQ